MLPSPLTLLIILIITRILYTLIRLLTNIRTARRTGLPYTVSFIHELETGAHLTDPLFRWAFKSRVLRGQAWPPWARFAVKDWHYEDRRRAHDELGPVFLVVSPGGMVCYVGDAETAVQVLTRRRAFVKPPEKMKMIEPFGANVVSVDGDTWRRHLAITLPPFAADNVLSLAWDETRRQVDVMADAWTSGRNTSLKGNIYSLTMNTMCLVGFGTSQGSGAGEVPDGHALSLVAAITEVVLHLPHILLVPKWALRRAVPRAYEGYAELEQYMAELVEQEKARLRHVEGSGEAARETLLTAVLRSNRENNLKTEKGPSLQLTDREIKGNIFMFLMAGYETTANTMLFCCMILTLYPAIQDACLEEVDRVWEQAEAEGRKDLSYAQDMPKFRYLVAFMYEVMRVFPIVLPLARVAVGPQELQVRSQTHLLPPGTGVVVNNTAIQHDPAVWPSPSVIDPRRWLSSDPHLFDPEATQTSAPEFSSEVRIPGHRRGTFMAFGEGPRACMGRNFARAEFVSFYSRLLRKYRLQLGAGVDPEEVERTIRNRSGGSPVTLIPPEDVRIDLVERVL